MNLSKSDLDSLTYEIIGACIEVHKEVGPGLLESIYHRCLKHELQLRNINFKSELLIPIHYKGKKLDADLRCDLVIEDSIVLELKSVEKMIPVFDAQLLTYMKLLKLPEGILINFNSFNLFRDGQKTLVNDLFKQLVD